MTEKSLYERFGFVFEFAHGPRNVAITLFYAQRTDSVWVRGVSGQPALTGLAANLTVVSGGHG